MANHLAWLPTDIQAMLQDEVRCAALFSRPRVGEPISSTTLDAWHRAGLAHAQQKGLVFSANSLALALKVRGVTPLSLGPALAHYRKTGALVTISEVAAKREEAEKGRLAKVAGWVLWAATAAPRALLRAGTALGSWASDQSESGGLDDEASTSSYELGSRSTSRIRSETEMSVDEHKPMVWLSAAVDACAKLAQHAQSLDPVSRAVALPVNAHLASVSDSDDPVTFGHMCEAAGLDTLSLQAQSVLVDILAVSGRVRVSDADANMLRSLRSSTNDATLTPQHRDIAGVVQWRAVQFLLDSDNAADRLSSGSSISSDVVLVRARLAAAELAHQIATEEVTWFGNTGSSSSVDRGISRGHSVPATDSGEVMGISPSKLRHRGKRHAMMAAALLERMRGNTSGCAQTLQRIKKLEDALNKRRSALATAQEALDSARRVACATSDVAAIQRASAALQHALSDGPTAADVHTALDTASELQADAIDVTNAMSPGKGSITGGIDEGFEEEEEEASELEAELLDLMGRQGDKGRAPPPATPFAAAPPTEVPVRPHPPLPSPARVAPLAPAASSAPPTSEAPATQTPPMAEAVNSLTSDCLPVAPSHQPQLAPSCEHPPTTATEVTSVNSPAVAQQGEEDRDDDEALDRELESLALA